MSQKEFEVEGIGLIKVYKRRGSRNLRLSVLGDGQIRVTSPPWVPFKTSLAFVESKRDWLLTKARPSASARLEAGQLVGKGQRLIYRDSTSSKVVQARVTTSQVVVLLPPNVGSTDSQAQDAARSACIRALRGQAKNLIKKRLDQLATKHNLSYRSFKVKQMRSRWGSCDDKQNLVFNLFLVQLPWELIDYVIIHELTHTKVMRHGPDFWAEMEQLLPNAKELRRQIRQHSPVLRLS